MPFITRPDGVRLAYEEQGEGPLVVLANQFFGDGDTFWALIRDLAADHHFVSYHLRGTGNSDREGPYDFETDAGDLQAVIETGGTPAVVLAFADGCNRAVRVAARRPDLVTAVVSPGGNPVGLDAVEGTDALAGSAGVLDALVGMMSTDYRGALRTMFSSANPDWEEDRVRERVVTVSQTVPQEAALPRMKAWIADSVTEESRALGDRLWMLDPGGNPWFPIEVSRRTRTILPDAHILEIEDGAISRPDITAGIVRRLTSAEPVASQGREQPV